jgi:hypothetical protein
LTVRAATRPTIGPSAGIALSFALVACGGASSVAESAGSSTSAAAASEVEASSEESREASASTAEKGSTTSYVRVTIGGETWEFGPEEDSILERCDSNFFGGYWVLFRSGIEMVLPGENWAAQGVEEPGRVEVTLEDGTEWVANPESLTFYGVQPGQSQIDSYSIDGSRAEGTATFVEASAVADGINPTTGTFEAACADDFGQ